MPVQALKCMLLAKIMTGDSSEVPSIISSRASLKYAGAYSMLPVNSSLQLQAAFAVAMTHKLGCSSNSHSGAHETVRGPMHVHVHITSVGNNKLSI